VWDLLHEGKHVTVTAPIGTTNTAATPARRVAAAAPEPSGLRDPLMPFLVIGVLTFIAIVLVAYALTSTV
jgi:hypothetical protein